MGFQYQGCDSHYNHRGHQIVADELRPQIAGILGWGDDSPYSWCDATPECSEYAKATSRLVQKAEKQGRYELRHNLCKTDNCDLTPEFCKHQTCHQLTKNYSCSEWYAPGKPFEGWCDRTCGYGNCRNYDASPFDKGRAAPTGHKKGLGSKWFYWRHTSWHALISPFFLDDDLLNYGIRSQAVVPLTCACLPGPL